MSCAFVNVVTLVAVVGAGHVAVVTLGRFAWMVSLERLVGAGLVG